MIWWWTRFQFLTIYQNQKSRTFFSSIKFILVRYPIYVIFVVVVILHSFYSKSKIEIDIVYFYIFIGDLIANLFDFVFFFEESVPWNTLEYTFLKFLNREKAMRKSNYVIFRESFSFCQLFGCMDDFSGKQIHFIVRYISYYYYERQTLFNVYW